MRPISKAVFFVARQCNCFKQWGAIYSVIIYLNIPFNNIELEKKKNTHTHTHKKKKNTSFLCSHLLFQCLLYWSCLYTCTHRDMHTHTHTHLSTHCSVSLTGKSVWQSTTVFASSLVLSHCLKERNNNPQQTGIQANKNQPPQSISRVLEKGHGDLSLLLPRWLSTHNQPSSQWVALALIPHSHINVHARCVCVCSVTHDCLQFGWG